MSYRNSFVVDNGRTVLIWNDWCCRDNLLCVLFPLLFALFVSKDVWVMDVWNSFAERGVRVGIFVSLDLVMIGRWIT